jgi:tetratricopeptide (TPR) repeat protein
VPLEIALIYLFHELPSKALSRARQAVEKAPDKFYAWFIQGQCEQALGFDRQAKLCYERVLELSPRHIEANHKLAEVANPSLSRRLRRLIGR